MKVSLLSLIVLSSLVSAIPAPQRGGHRKRPSATIATQVAATPAVTSAVAAEPAPAVSTRASAAAVTTAAAGTFTAGSGTGGGGDSHKVTVINNCGSGSVQWQHQGLGQTTFPAGSTTVDKSIVSAIMWLDGYNGFKCGPNAINCGMVEFTLGDNGHNAINYSLLMQNLGNHILRAPMFIELTGGTCSAKAGGPCTGMTVAECPNGYTGTDTETGPPVDCAGTGVGATITFCP